MTQDLESIFGELGITQYLNAFLDQGFDAWDTILDIQESDLDALGVKLGHRRKLQRRIANARGIAPSVSLPSPVRQPSEERKQESATRPEQLRVEPNHDNGNGVTKRKYRRHPKPDENAPERPPSAYVLFSNKMREDLKSQNLTFTEIAKLVGEHWQNLDPAEKEIYESQANAAKDKYHQDLAEYKKTSEYRKYSQYLQEFKERQAKQSSGHDSTKRAKLEPARLRHGSTSSSATPAGSASTGSGNGSGSERRRGSCEPPLTRQRRGNSTASLTESHHSSTAPTPVSHRNSFEEPGPSPRTTRFDNVHRESGQGHSRQNSSWRDYGRSETGTTHLPSLSDMLDDNRGISSGGIDGSSYTSGFVAANQRRRVPDGPTARQAVPPPLLPHEPSSSGSNLSGNSGASFSRGPGEGPLPIHALLSDRRLSSNTATYETSPASSIGGSRGSGDQGKPTLGHSGGPRGYGTVPVLTK
ncbi:High mobility group protein 20A [Paramyrothecium foliicola]|nr:High mobility group protein 20A [Paramyrothecium foliicola]